MYNENEIHSQWEFVKRGCTWIKAIRFAVVACDESSLHGEIIELFPVTASFKDSVTFCRCLTVIGGIGNRGMDPGL